MGGLGEVGARGAGCRCVGVGRTSLSRVRMDRWSVGRSTSVTFFLVQNLRNSSRSFSEPQGSRPSFLCQSLARFCRCVEGGNLALWVWSTTK